MSDNREVLCADCGMPIDQVDYALRHMHNPWTIQMHNYIIKHPIHFPIALRCT